jgi:hypothetical protein
MAISNTIASQCALNSQSPDFAQEIMEKLKKSWKTHHATVKNVTSASTTQERSTAPGNNI